MSELGAQDRSSTNNGPAQSTTEPSWGARGTAAVSFAASLGFENICHAYDTKTALDNVTFEIEAGEVMCLLGHSGCGKTTLLRIAAGVEVGHTGSVLMNRKEVSSDRVFIPPEKRGIGLVFQDFALFPHLTVLKNTLFGLRGQPAQAAREAAESALKRVGMLSHADKFPHMLSGGEQQRVALARAIAPRPSILLMDEPFSGLDSRLRDRIRTETLALLRETRTTTVIVTHDPEEAMRVGDRIAVMGQGRVIQIGEPDTLYRKPANLAIARFFSEINEIPAIVSDGFAKTPFGNLPADGFSDGAKVIVGVRPQGILLTKASGKDVQGRVIQRQFLGNLDYMEVAVADLDAPILALAPPGQALTGHDVAIGLDPAYSVVFPADSP